MMMSSTSGARHLTPDAQICVLGLGRMGRPVALNLAQRGFQVSGWNRTPPRPLQGVRALSGEAGLRRVVAGADVVVLALSDRSAIECVLLAPATLQALRPGVTVIDMGTTGPVAARAHARRLAEFGLAYLDAPVSGGVKGATDGALTILVGGALETFGRMAPAFSPLGTAHHLGDVGAGQVAKLANQIIVADYIAAVAEGLRFAEGQGLDPMALLKALQGGFADSAILRQHGPRMAEGDFRPGGTCRLHLKDLVLARSVGGTEFARLVNANAALQRLEGLVDAGQGELDHSAYYLTYYGDVSRSASPGD